MRSRLAFTLLELLTVIGILGILSSIAFPVVSRAREIGSTAACLSNLRQLGMGVSLYAADYDGLYPYGLDPALRSGVPLETLFDEPLLTEARQMPDMRQALSPYVRSSRLYRCPAEHPMDWQQAQASYYQRFGSSYSYDPYPALLGQNDSYYEKPAETYLMADINFWHQGQNSQDGRLNVLFADYHVKNAAWLYYLNTVKVPRQDSKER